MHRSPSANSVLSNGAGAGINSGSFLPSSTSDPSTPLSSGLPKFAKDFEDVHELLEEPVEEQVGHYFCRLLVVDVDDTVIDAVVSVVYTFFLFDNVSLSLYLFLLIFFEALKFQKVQKFIA